MVRTLSPPIKRPKRIRNRSPASPPSPGNPGEGWGEGSAQLASDIRESDPFAEPSPLPSTGVPAEGGKRNFTPNSQSTGRGARPAEDGLIKLERFSADRSRP